ncbi:MAG TPA: heavy metal translocating P-type ATPase [Anaerolineae bacterium]|nr:heavy metal translocating P-type ATPase [Anaerolineae bacterium]HPL28064.1 heavy metal translocating P-type ATPase [Anaerolineae bacterium]
MPTATGIYDIARALPNAAGCEQCISHLSSALEQRAGVQSVQFSHERDKLIVGYDPAIISAEDMANAVDSAGEAVSRRYRHERLNVTEMDCPECARGVEASLANMPGVQSARVEFALGQVELAYDAERVGRDEIVALIRALGYDVAERAPAALRFRLEGLDCAECAKGLESLVAGLPGVAGASINFGAATIDVQATGGDEVVAQITSAVSRAGYTARLEAGEVVRQPPRRDFWAFLFRQRRGRRTIAAGALTALGAILSAAPLAPWVGIVFYGLAIVVGGYDVARSAVASLRSTFVIDMNLLMTIAVIGAAAIGEWSEAAVVIFLFSLGNTLEAYTLDRARDAVHALIELTPQEATLIHGDHEERVRVEALHVGDLVRVRPGERIPADGEVAAGTSAVDESPITGEAVPVDKAQGDRVYAGTVSGHGALTVHVTQPVSDSALARIVRLVEQAQAQRAPSQRFVDRFARIYTPVVIAIAVAIAIIPPLLTGAPANVWILRALTLLVIACPCALVISTPVAIVSALGRAAHEGVLVKGGAYIETLGEVQAIAFDKTRTLTVGQPVVTDILPLGTASEAEVLTLAAALERNSEHPLAQAVVREARHRGIYPPPAADFQALPGRGARGVAQGTTFTIGNRSLLAECLTIPPQVEARLLDLEREGKTVFVLGRCEPGDRRGEVSSPHHRGGEEPPPNGGEETSPLRGIIAVADRARPEAREAVASLRQAGIRHTVMLTGDNPATAAAIARELGIDEVRANLLPEDKVGAIAGLLAKYGSVAMVGDGVNDAPALARATVGIAMGAAGSDAALETADIALMGDDLAKVPRTLQLSRRTLAVIRQNIGFSLAVKFAFVALAVLGIATLWSAVFADVGTSLIVTLNGMRLARR